KLGQQPGAVVSGIIVRTVLAPMRQYLSKSVVSKGFVSAIRIIDSGDQVRQAPDTATRVSGRFTQFVRDDADVVRIGAVGIGVIDVVAIWMKDLDWVADHRFVGVGGGIAVPVLDD